MIGSTNASVGGSGGGVPGGYTVTFMDGDEIFSVVSVQAGGKVAKPASEPSMPDYKFDGWYSLESGGSAISFPFTPQKDTTVYAQHELMAISFASDTPFTLRVSSPGWDGTMEWSTGIGWSVWDGSTISSSPDGKMYLRGTGNTRVGPTYNGNYFTFQNASNMSMAGDLGCLLDYSTVANGGHPGAADYTFNCLMRAVAALTNIDGLRNSVTSAPASSYDSMFLGCSGLTNIPSGLLPAKSLGSLCYKSMFYGCSGITSIPNGLLPATSLSDYCYWMMFQNCSGITSIPSNLLPATKMASLCYAEMFDRCSNLRISSGYSATYNKTFRIPASGTGTASGATNWNRNMFRGTGGTFTGTPSINTTYYMA